MDEYLCIGGVLMGSRGPVPKREESRHRRNAPSMDVAHAQSSDGTAAPEPDPDWHPIARRLWDSAAKSGQSRFYQASDWAVLYSLMDDLTYYKNGSKRSGQMLQTIMSSLTSLLLTEGDRRRLQIELSRPEQEDEAASDVAVMNEWRKRLG